MSEARLRRLHPEAARIIRHLRLEDGVYLDDLEWRELEDFVNCAVRNAVRTALLATMDLLIADPKEAQR